MSKIKIFVSHSSKYSEIAKTLKRALQALEATELLDIAISEEMPGSTKWRDWIDDNVKTSDVFLLLYPDDEMDMGWCNYELGRFYDKDRKVICIKNVDIATPPPAFQPFQCYNADGDDLMKFLNELFVQGTFSNEIALNKDIGRNGSQFYHRAKEVATEIETLFVKARVRPQYYDRRIVISVVFDETGKLNGAASTVKGNSAGLQLFGLSESAVRISWQMVRGSKQGAGEWTRALEDFLPSIADGNLPPALPPIQTEEGQIYIPVITRTESIDHVLREIIMIFVAVNVKRLRPLFDWSQPDGMPESLKSILAIAKQVFRARWEIVGPAFQEAKFRNPPVERQVEIANHVASEYEQMQKDAEANGGNGFDQFLLAFHPELRKDVLQLIDQWMELMGQLKSSTRESPSETRDLLNQLLKNNAAWMTVIGQQFSKVVADLA